MDIYGKNYLKNKLINKASRVDLRYRFYEMKDRAYDPGITIPRHLRDQYAATLGWCAKAVDALSDRLVFRGFGNDYFSLNEIYQLNNPDTLPDSAMLSALISSCSFIYISRDDEGFPRLQVIDGANATGILDPITGLLTEGYAVLERNKSGEVIRDAYFLPHQTQIWTKGAPEQAIESVADHPLLVPIIFRPDARRPFGHSRISRACMYFQDYAKRVLERSDVSAEFYSFPQKYVVGMSEDADQMETWKATISSFLRFDKDDDGDRPTLGQFTQQSMSPYTEQLRTAAAGFAGETGLTLDDLGFATDNPSSAEAIKAAHENLRCTARKAQRTFGSGFLNAGYLAACERDGIAYARKVFYETVPLFEPVFEPDAAGLSGIGDAALKINQAIPGYFGRESLRTLTGIVPEGEDSGQL